MTLGKFITEAKDLLRGIYPVEEVRSILQRLLQDLFSIPWYKTVIEPEMEFTIEQESQLSLALQRLSKGEPLQYVIGWTEFCGRRFKVAPGVLIPRPETESLCLLVQTASQGRDSSPVPNPKILDLCTGSGCIAWTLALDIPGAHVTAVDISSEALAIASSQNPDEFALKQQKFVSAKMLRRPAFIKADVLDRDSLEDFDENFDFVVSNPPYVMDKEKSCMRANVLDYEPHLALFVPDDDPLIFYKAIAFWAINCLKPGGQVMVEINEALGAQTAQVFVSAGLEKVRIAADIFDKERFVCAYKPL